MGKTRKSGKIAVAALLIAGFAVFSVCGDEVAEVWSRVYKRAASIFQKYEIVQSMVELDNRDLAPVFVEALDELVKWEGRSLDTREIVTREETKLLVVKELGELKAAEAAPLLWQVVDETDEPILKSEALVALGKTGDKSYAQQIARILDSLNLYRGKRAADEDIIALGCIRALEAMKDIVGYKPVFYATAAGYQSRVSERAERALGNITDDPTPVLKEIIADEADLSLKRLALDQTVASDAPEAGKLEVAVEALYQGITVSTTRIVENTSLREMRKTALQLIRDLSVESDAAVFLIGKVLYLDTDENEKLLAIEALVSIGSRGAAQALTRFLGEQNDRRGEDLTTETDRILIAVIKAIAEIGDDVAYEELLRAEFANYSYDVEVEVRAALEIFD
jgi:hypothetical protein